jgi:hypothetical protein
MQSTNSIQQRREAILAELAGLDLIRRGSVTEQMVRSVGRRGREMRRGPYPVYTFKAHGRTVSRRIRAEEVPVYREQIEAGRRFQELVRELMELGEQAGDTRLRNEAEKKTPNV